MNKRFFVIFAFVFGIFSAQQHAYCQQHAKYKMDIEVDATHFTYQGKQTLTYTNNSPDELKVVYFHLYWNAFKPGSMMDQRVAGQGKMEIHVCKKMAYLDWLRYRKNKKVRKIFIGLNKMGKT